MNFVLTTFPVSDNVANLMSKQRFEYLTRYVDYFHIMAYDYLSHLNEKNQTAIKRLYNSPVSWIKNTVDIYVDSSKPNKDSLYKRILLGIPFHGFIVDKTGEKPKGHPIDGSQLLQYLEANKDGVLTWDDEEKEHLFDFSKKEKIFMAVYPTRKFIKERLDLATTLNLGGVGIWDISQGLECYLDII